MKYLGAITDDLDMVNKKYVDDAVDNIDLSNSKIQFDEVVCNSLLVNGNARIVNGTLVGGVYTTASATLTTAGWSSNSQTVSVTGVTASNLVIVTPAPASSTAWSTSGIACTGQGAGTLTFSCEAVPTAAISVNIVIL